jgi:hypothetical protein
MRSLLRRMLIHVLNYRPNIQLSCQIDVGVHCRKPHPKRLPIMANIRTSHASPEMDMDRKWPGWRSDTESCLLDAEDSHVCPQFCI